MDDKLYDEIVQLLRKGMTERDIAIELEIPERVVYGVARRRKSKNNPNEGGTT